MSAYGPMVTDAAKLLKPTTAAPKTLFIATSDEPQIVADAQRFVQTLAAQKTPGLKYTYEPMPAETHMTIYHPAALRSFRQVFKPAAAPSSK